MEAIASVVLTANAVPTVNVIKLRMIVVPTAHVVLLVANVVTSVDQAVNVVPIVLVQWSAHAWESLQSGKQLHCSQPTGTSMELSQLSSRTMLAST